MGRAKRSRHNMKDTLIYGVWTTMKSRCNNPRSQQYKYYGGRGIQVCEQWNAFLQFFADMGLPPSPKHSIDRINNEGNYEPGNCRWATKKQQEANKRKGTRCLTAQQIAQLVGISRQALYLRIERLGSLEKALLADKFKQCAS